MGLRNNCTCTSVNLSYNNYHQIDPIMLKHHYMQLLLYICIATSNKDYLNVLLSDYMKVLFLYYVIA